MFEILRKHIFVGPHIKPKRTLLLLDFKKNWKILINRSKNFPAWYFIKYSSSARLVTCRRTDKHTDRSKKTGQFCTLSLQTLQAALTLPDVRNLHEGFRYRIESLAVEKYAVFSLEKTYSLCIQFCSSHNWNMVHGIWCKYFMSCHLSSWK